MLHTNQPSHAIRTPHSFRIRLLPRLAGLALALTLLPIPVGTALEADPAQDAALLAVPPVQETVTTLPWQVEGPGGGVVDTTVEQHVLTFSAAPASFEDLTQYPLDSPYQTMALLIMAFRTWTPENPDTCLRMLDYLTDTGANLPGTDQPCPFSRYNPWISALKDRMTQNNKYRYIGNAYLGGATPENNYTPDTPFTVTLRQSPYWPYAEASATAPEQYQVLVRFPGADNDRYCLFYRAENGAYKVFRSSWQNLLADIKTASAEILLPPETVRAENPAHPQREPEVTVTAVPAKAPGIDENGNAAVLDVTVEQYTFSFSTIPTCYEDIVQYKLDSPYKTMALLFLAFRTWTPENPTDCCEMMNYLTNTGVNSGNTDSSGRKLSKNFSDYAYWTDFVRDRMKQNNKYRYIGNAYLGGAAPSNDYTPTQPLTVTVRQSVYDPYTGATSSTPELKQILIHIDGADNDRYALFYQDQRGDWRVWSDHWKGLLADVQTPIMDVLLPPETVIPANPAHPQTEPEETIFEIPAKAPGVDDMGNAVVIDTTVQQHTFTFSTVPASYEDIVQYKLDSPYKAMALLIMAFRAYDPQNPSVCYQMLNYLTNTNADSGKKDANGRKLSRNFSDYQFWTDFVRDRMRQNDKYRYIGNAYLGGAMPSNDYTPTEPFTITVRQSVYDPYKPSSGGSETDPTLYQVLISIPGADNDRYCIFYQDPRGDYRVWSDNWKGLLTDVQTPTGDVPYPAEVVRAASPARVQTDPEPVITKVPGKAVGEDGKVIDVTVDQYAFTFPIAPTCYEDIVQYKLDSPYKTMALLFLAYRTWTPENPTDCLQMLDYLTNTATPQPGVTDKDGHKLCYPFSQYNPWISALKDRMTQNDKYRYIGNAYLNGASPANNYTPDSPITVTVRQSVYDPFVEQSKASPEIKQVLITLSGADNDRYALFYQDQRGDWRVFGDNWMGVLADVKAPAGDALWPPEITRPASSTQKEPTVKTETIPGKALDPDGNVVDAPVKQYTFTFSTVPSHYGEIVQYKLDSPYKTMALLFLAYRTWTPENPETCLQMLDYLTNTNAPSGKQDADGNRLSVPFSRYNPWISALKDRMTQNDKYQYIGNAYLGGAAPSNGYTPSTPVTVTVRQSVYDPYKAASDTNPELKQVLVHIEGADSDRYAILYQDQRGDWRIYGDEWQGLLAGIREPGEASLSITGAKVSGGILTFHAEVPSYGTAWAASYDTAGRMIAVTEAAGRDGDWTADVPLSAASHRIMIADVSSQKPLCNAVVVR